MVDDQSNGLIQGMWHLRTDFSTRGPGSFRMARHTSFSEQGLMKLNAAWFVRPPRVDLVRKNLRMRNVIRPVIETLQKGVQPREIRCTLWNFETEGLQCRAL